MITRRSFLSTASLGAGLLAAPAIVRARTASTADGVPDLRAMPATAQLVPPEFGRTDVWGYDGRVPGPEIRLRAGERLRRRLVNELPQSTAVHWHGIRLPNAMDGAAGLTQAPVEPGKAKR